jgi:hypothetical protein
MVLPLFHLYQTVQFRLLSLEMIHYKDGLWKRGSKQSDSVKNKTCILTKNPTLDKKLDTSLME